MIHRSGLLLLLFFHVCSFIRASEPLSFPPERRVIFTCLSWDDEIDTAYYRTLIHDPNAAASISSKTPRLLIPSTASIKIASSFRSEAQPYLGPAAIEFFATPPLVHTASANADPRPVASVLLPPDKHNLMLLFLKQTPTSDHPGPQYRIEILPDNPGNLPMGGYLLMNTTGKKLIGSAGHQTFELEPRSAKALPFPGDAPQKLEWIFWNATRKEKPLYSSLWQHHPDGRTLIFITESAEQRGDLAIKAILETGEPDTPEEEPPAIPK